MATTRTVQVDEQGQLVAPASEAFKTQNELLGAGEQAADVDPTGTAIAQVLAGKVGKTGAQTMQGQLIISEVARRFRLRGTEAAGLLAFENDAGTVKYGQWIITPSGEVNFDCNAAEGGRIVFRTAPDGTGAYAAVIIQGTGLLRTLKGLELTDQTASRPLALDADKRAVTPSAADFRTLIDALGTGEQAADVDPAGTAIAAALAGKVDDGDYQDGEGIDASSWRDELEGELVPQDDSRLSDAREWSAATIDQAEAEAGTETTRRAWTAQRVRQAIAAWWATITDVVKTAGDQSIAGEKTFTSRLVSNDLRARTDDGLDVAKSDGTSLIRVGKDGDKTGVAEGLSTSAEGDYSHAEGLSTSAEGDYSHAEGAGATANGIASHAEGDSTTANGLASHAEGGETIASGEASHAGGIGSLASQVLSYARGRRARAIHIGASVESDNENADFESTADNQKSFRFAGGYRFVGGAAEFLGGIVGLVIGTDIQAQDATLQSLADAADDAARRAAVGGAIGDAPSDGSQYARKDAGWEEVEATSPTITALDLDENKSITPAVNGEIHNVTLEGNHTLTLNDPADTTKAVRVTVRTIQDGTGGRTITWAGTIASPGAVTPPAPTTDAAAVDQYEWLWTGARYELVGAIFDVEAL